MRTKAVSHRNIARFLIFPIKPFYLVFNMCGISGHNCSGCRNFKKVYCLTSFWTEGVKCDEKNCHGRGLCRKCPSFHPGWLERPKKVHCHCCDCLSCRERVSSRPLSSLGRRVDPATTTGPLTTMGDITEALEGTVSNTKERRTCPHCSQLILVNKNNTLRTHKGCP